MAAELDLRIAGGVIVDGTGSPGRRADVGVKSGRVVALGRDAETAATRVIDADGQVVAPGFVDVHTHYDAQLFWDQTLSPSALHGVTTVIAGNCGLTLAPVAPEHEDFLTRLLARVEAIPVNAIQSGVPFRWRSFGEFLDVVSSRPTAVNLGFLTGHSALRRAAMGRRASESTASRSELARMQAMLGDALRAGSLGFSSSTSPTQVDGDGSPSPPNFAAPDELIALAAVCAEQPGTSLEFVPSSFLQGFTQEHLDLMGDMSAAANRHLNWNSVLINEQKPEIHERQVGSADAARERGGCVVPMVIPHNFRTRTDFLESDVGFRLVPGWEWLFGLAAGDRVKALADTSARAKLAASFQSATTPMAESLREGLGDYVVSDCDGPAASLVGRCVRDVAHSRGSDELSTVFDLAVETELGVGFVRYMFSNSTPGTHELRSRVLRDHRVMLGASDGGAHLRSVVNVEYPTMCFEELVRALHVFTVEELVHELADKPARLYGLVGRGRLVVGGAGDVVVFDPASIAPTPVRMVADLPGGARRLFTGGVGISTVIVNGQVVAEDGRYTGVLPGRLLRSGVDTRTVTVGDAWAVMDGDRGR